MPQAVRPLLGLDGRAEELEPGAAQLDRASVVEKLVGREMLFLREGGFKDGEALAGDTEPLFSEIGLKFFAGGFVAHGAISRR